MDEQLEYENIFESMTDDPAEAEKMKLVADAVSYFAAYLIDNHERAFPGGEDQIQHIGGVVLKDYFAKYFNK